jgi:sugar lactone lactonase YvrE
MLALTVAQAQTSPDSFLFSHLAGSVGGPGSADGAGSVARFHSPAAVAVDHAGNLYVADVQNNTIRKVSPGGVVSTLAGLAGVAGSTDGTGTAARFSSPQGIAVDSSGTLYVADSGNSTIRRITPSGVVTTLAGTAGALGSGDGIGAAAWFWYPRAIAVDSAGTLYVADNSTIRKIAAGGVVSTLAGKPGPWGNADGTGSAAQFTSPGGIAVDAAGTVFVADSGNNKIRKITPDGVVTSLADGNGNVQFFYNPLGVAVDRAGVIYVANSSYNLINKITPGASVTVLAGTDSNNYSGGTADGSGDAARFTRPGGLAVDGAGMVFVADTNNHTIRKITADGVVSTLAGLAVAVGNTDGTGAAARFDYPGGVAVDGSGNIYVSDAGRQTIRKITPAGAVTTIFGTSVVLSDSDRSAGGYIFYDTGMAVDRTGNIYEIDSRFQSIIKITPGGGTTTLAGYLSFIGGSADGTGTAAQFNGPRGLAADGAGNVYVTDTGNQTIRKIAPGGVVTTLAGTPGGGGGVVDGTGASARFFYPLAIAVDGAGNVYVEDDSTIRKIAPSGVVTTLAGTAGVSGRADGTGAAAQFTFDSGVVNRLAVDGAGTVYVLDRLNSTLRKITAGGVVTTIAGQAGKIGCDDGVGTAAGFSSPAGVAVDSAGNLYVADAGNQAIRKGVPAGPPVITAQPLSQTVTEGTSVQFSVTASAVPTPTYQWYFSGSPFSGATANTLSFSSARSTDAGDYTVIVTNQLGAVTSSKATLTVATAPVAPPATPTPSAGGGGAIDVRFALALLALVGARRFAGSKKSQSEWRVGRARLSSSGSSRCSPPVLQRQTFAPQTYHVFSPAEFIAASIVPKIPLRFHWRTRATHADIRFCADCRPAIFLLPPGRATRRFGQR